ncbi:MAG: hypothetical protein ABIJ09_05450 [Pseudomonadota bacterium]
MGTERRRERSDDYPRALRLQLAASAARGAFHTVALTGPSGRVLAHAGDSSRVAELGSLPLHVVRSNHTWRGHMYTPAGVQRVTVTPVTCKLGQLYLCAVGGAEVQDPQILAAGGAGVARIVDRHCPLRRRAA